MWSASPLSTASLKKPNDVWVDVPDTAVVFEIYNEATVLISYDVAVSRIVEFSEASQRTTAESEVAFRITVDGVPYRGSGSTVGDNEPEVTVASGYLIRPLLAGQHDVRLQWRRRGERVNKWIISSDVLDGFAGGRNLIVSAQHKYIWYTQPLTTASLDTSDIWVPVPDMTLSFRLSEATKMRFFYQLPVRPQLTRYSRSRKWNQYNM